MLGIALLLLPACTGQMHQAFLPVSLHPGAPPVQSDTSRMAVREQLAAGYARFACRARTGHGCQAIIGTPKGIARSGVTPASSATLETARAPMSTCYRTTNGRWICPPPTPTPIPLPSYDPNPGNPDPPALHPSDLESAYSFTNWQYGLGVTVALIEDTFDPNLEHDNTIYREQYGLHPCTSASGCLTQLDAYGTLTQLPASDGDYSETMLDVDAVSAVELQDPGARCEHAQPISAVAVGYRNRNRCKYSRRSWRKRREHKLCGLGVRLSLRTQHVRK